MNRIFGMEMKSVRVFLLLFGALAMSSCAGTAPKYGPNRSYPVGIVGDSYSYGYFEVPLDSITAVVTFLDPFSTNEADRLALYRAAELTGQHGFDYFIVSYSRVDAGTATKTIRMYKGEAPSDNPLAYNAKSMLTVMGSMINRAN